MGSKNVGKVFTYWTRLSHREIRALVYMANKTLDAGKPPVYFGGWEAVAEALGLDPKGKRASAQEAFRQTLAALVRVGAVVSSGQAKLGVRAEYALALEPGNTFEVLDCGDSEDGRRVRWKSVPREGSRDSRESGKCPNDSLPQVPQSDVAPASNDSLPQVPQSDVGKRPNKALPPMSTEEQKGGTQEEQQGETTSWAPHLTREPTRARESEIEKPLSLEDERNRQLNALEEIMANGGKAS